MTVMNVKLGGAADWTDQTPIKSADVKDTFDAAADKIQSLSTFWLNSYLYMVYDDFDSESTGAISTNTKWTYTGASIVVSTNAGGSGKEASVSVLSGSTGTGSMVSKLLPANHHIFCRFFGSCADDDEGTVSTFTVSFGNATDGFTTVVTQTTTRDLYQNNAGILVVAKGSNIYDVYLGHTKILSDSSKPNGPQLSFSAYVQTNGGEAKMYVDDVRYSTGAV